MASNTTNQKNMGTPTTSATQGQTEDMVFRKIQIDVEEDIEVASTENSDVYRTTQGYEYKFEYYPKGYPDLWITYKGKYYSKVIVSDEVTVPGGGIFVKDPNTGRYTPTKKEEPKKEPEQVNIEEKIHKKKTQEFIKKRVRVKKGKKEEVVSDIEDRKVQVLDGCSIIAEVSAKHSCKFIYGRTQSGKTKECCVTMVARMRVDQCPGVYICRDYTAELEDQFTSMSQIIQEIVGDRIQVVPVYGNSTSWNQIVQAMKNKDSSKIFLIMGNAAVLNKLNKCFSNGDRVRFTCVLDEADIYLNDSKISVAVKNLMSAAVCKYFVSATLLDISSLIDDDEIVEAVPSKFAFKNEVEGDDRVYRSLHSAIRYDPKNDGRKVSDAIDNGKQIVTESVDCGWNTEYNHKGLPFTICHFTSDANEDNKKIATAISAGRYGTGYKHKVSAITFDQLGVKLYEDGVVVQEFDKLNQAMQKTKDDGRKFVYIMGGKMCSRAFRVTSEDWEMYISLMIYQWGDSEASLIVQRMGRMCGLTPKHLICPQRIFVTKKTFYKAIDCTNATSELVRTVHTNPRSEFAVVKRSVVLGERKTNVKISKSGVEKDFEVDANKENMHGETREWDEVAEEPEEPEETEPRDENFEIFVPADYDSLNSTLRTVYDRMEEYCSRHYDENKKDEHLRADILNEFVREYKYDYSTLARRMSDMADTQKKGKKINKFQHGVNFYTRKDDPKQKKTIYVKYVN